MNEPSEFEPLKFNCSRLYSVFLLRLRSDRPYTQPDLSLYHKEHLKAIIYFYKNWISAIFVTQGQWIIQKEVSLESIPQLQACGISR